MHDAKSGLGDPDREIWILLFQLVAIRVGPLKKEDLILDRHAGVDGYAARQADDAPGAHGACIIAGCEHRQTLAGSRSTPASIQCMHVGRPAECALQPASDTCADCV